MKKMISTIIITFIVFLLLILWAVFQDKSDFINVSLYELITLFVTIIVAFLGIIITINISEKNNDLRIKKERMENEIINLQSLLLDEDLRFETLGKCSDLNVRIMRKISRVHNQLDFIKKYFPNEKFKENYDLIDKNMTMYDSVLDYIMNETIVEKNKDKLVQHLEDIEQYLRNIRIVLMNECN